MNTQLKGITALVTGGGRGIGRSISCELAKQGADVIIGAVTNIASARDTVNELAKYGGKPMALQVDITNEQSVNEMVSVIIHRYKKIDLLVNNAGLSIKAPLEKISISDWGAVVNVNLNGTFLCSITVAKHMIKRCSGKIINIIGAGGHRCYANGGAFGPSKAAIINLTKQMSVEWARYKILVNGVSPGPIITEESKDLFKEEGIRKRILQLPLRRAGKPEEIAKVVAFLASGDSSYITGQIIIVDGGSVNSWYLNP